MSFLNKKIISFDPEIFGLDLSDLSLKIVQIEGDKKQETVSSFASADIPAGNIEDGKIVNKEAVAEIIKEAIKKSGPKKIKTKKVICSLPESKVFLRIISIPKMSKEETEEAIKWEMEASIPIPIDQAYFDWQVFDSSNEKKENVLTVAVSKEIADDLMEVLAKAGLEVYGLEVESIATARSLIAWNDKNSDGEKKAKEDAKMDKNKDIKKEINTEANKDSKEEKDMKNDKDGGFLIVDLGEQRTSFIIVKRGVPSFTSSIPFSSQSINDAISKGLNLDADGAEKIKISHGIESKDDNPVFNVVKPLLENLIQEIEKTLDFYAGMSKESSVIEKIILCGGGSNLKGLPAYLNERLNKSIELGNPWVNLKLGDKPPIIDKDSAGRYATAIGLALRGFDYEKNQSHSTI